MIARIGRWWSSRRPPAPDTRDRGPGPLRRPGGRRSRAARLRHAAAGLVTAAAPATALSPTPRPGAARPPHSITSALLTTAVLAAASGLAPVAPGLPAQRADAAEASVPGTSPGGGPGAHLVVAALPRGHHPDAAPVLAVPPDLPAIPVVAVRAHAVGGHAARLRPEQPIPPDPPGSPTGDATAAPPAPPGAGVPAPGARYAWPLLPPPAVATRFRAPPHAYGRGHRGVDLTGSAGQPVLAARGGTVVFAGPVGGRGVVSVHHDDGLRSTYEPVRPAVAAGAVVRAGEVIGVLEPGHAGCVPAACLHWGVRRGRLEYLDPLVLLRPPEVRLLPVPDPWPGDAP